MVFTNQINYLIVGFIVGLILQGIIVASSSRTRLIAAPSERGLHDFDIPTAGGLGFVVPILFFLMLENRGDAELLNGIFWGCFLVAVISLWDDIKELKPILRLLCHAIAVYLVIQGMILPGGTILAVIAAVVLVWHINLYNFMDGIDGIAGAQCLVFCIGIQIIGYPLGGWVGSVLWLLIGSIVAFLVFNWPKAKVFMGDVGSAVLGLLLAIVGIHLWSNGHMPIGTPFILLSAFIFDTTYTLLIRIFTGQRFFLPHRSHLYQRLAEKKGHLWTTLSFVVFGIFWLIPLAWVTSHFADWQYLIASVAISPLLVMSIKYRVGLSA